MPFTNRDPIGLLALCLMVIILSCCIRFLKIENKDLCLTFQKVHEIVVLFVVDIN